MFTPFIFTDHQILEQHEMEMAEDEIENKTVIFGHKIKPKNRDRVYRMSAEPNTYELLPRFPLQMPEDLQIFEMDCKRTSAVTQQLVIIIILIYSCLENINNFSLIN